MKIMKYIIRSSDFLGPTIGFEYKGNKNFQSYQGSLYSLIIISISVVICFLFGQEIYQRKIPITYYSQQNVPDSSVTLKDFPILFLITDGYGLPIPNIKEIITIDLVEETISPKLVVNRSIYEFDIAPCNFTTFDSKYQSSIRKDLANSLIPFQCFDYGTFFFRNNFATIDSTYLNIRFRLCDNTTLKCLPNAQDIISNIFVTFVYFDSYVDPTNYTNPIQYTDKSIETQLSNGLLKRYITRVVNNVLFADNGWLLESVDTFNYISLNDYMSTYDLVDPASTYALDRFWITFESPTYRFNTYRSYLKIQDLLAKIGGIAKFLLILIQFLTEHHLKFLYLQFIKRLANDEIEYQVKDSKDKKEIVLDNDKDKDKNKISSHDINNSNIELVRQNMNLTEEFKTVEITKLRKIEKLPSNNPNKDLINPNVSLNNELSTKPKLNNFLMKSKTIQEFYSFHTEKFNYFDYIKSHICLDYEKSKRYDKSLDLIKSLIDIKLFSRLMVNVHHGTMEN